MIRIILAFAIALLALGSISGATGNSLTFLTDYASYADLAEKRPYIEIYCGLNRDELGFIGSDTSEYLYAGVYLSAIAYDESGAALDSASTYFLSRVKDREESLRQGIQLFDLLGLHLDPGHYRILCSAVDDVSKKSSRNTIVAEIPDYFQPGLRCSDLQVAFEISTLNLDDDSPVNNRLIKQDRVVIPNPTGRYQAFLNKHIWVYAELYGLSFEEEFTSAKIKKFFTNYSLKDMNGNLIHDFGGQAKDKPGTSAVVVNCLELPSIPTGDYYLIFEVTDAATGAKTLASKAISIVASELAQKQYSIEDVELMRNIAYYHLSEAEKIQIDKLSIEGKKNFIHQFWRTRDDDPSDAKNPVYEEAIRRFVFANEMLSTRSDTKDGWKTDRGRIYITYGPYNDAETVEMEGRSYPYQKWTYYNLDGRKIFVFVNDFMAQIGDYRLVHSTHPREKYDPVWQQILDKEDDTDSDWRDSRDNDW
ncbi:MAG: GWxTD domain-containing protein [candidate division Zixibacteria bacterium]